jgi:hypothetical protein
MTHWQHYLIEKYTHRLQEETRPEAKQFIRQTLKELKDVEPANNNNNCVCHLASSLLNQQTKDFISKI